MTLVAVDIGGTNIRLAVVRDDGGLAEHRSMLCADFPSFEAAITAYADATAIKVSAASVAVAGPVQDDLVGQEFFVEGFQQGLGTGRADISGNYDFK